MPRSKEEPPGPRPVPRPIPPPLRDRVRRQQIVGMLILAAAILIVTLLRAGWHNLFPAGWWRW